MGAERLYRGVVPRQFRFGQRGVYFVVADLMNQNRRTAPSAFQPGREVVLRLFRLNWNRAEAKGADRFVGHTWSIAKPRTSANGVRKQGERHEDTCHRSGCASG